MNKTQSKKVENATEILKIEDVVSTQEIAKAVVASAPAKKSNAELVADIKKGLKTIVQIKRNIMKDIKDINVNQLAEDCASLERYSINVSNLSQILQLNVSSQNK